MTSLVVSLISGAALLAAPPTLDSDIDTALGSAGLNAKTARFDPLLLRFFQQGEVRTPVFEAMHQDPWRAPFYADAFRRQFATSVGKPYESLQTGATMLGAGVRRTLLGSPIAHAQEQAGKSGALLAMLNSLKERGLLRGEIPSLATVPPPVQEAAALVLDVSLEAVAFRRAAFAGAKDLDQRFERYATEAPESEAPDDVLADLAFFRSIDTKLLFASGHDMTMAAMAAQTIVQGVSPDVKYDWSIETAWGAITLTGGGPTQHPDRATLLTIDTGGNDAYLGAPSNRSVNNWLSVVIDTNGSDSYISAPTLATGPVATFAGRKDKKGWGPANALMGISILLDLRGDDVYRSHRPGLGAGTFGVGVLHDAQGTDLYDAYANAEGFGWFGLGLLEDGGGIDIYTGFSAVQGYGRTGGFGMLMDRSGSDRYVANDEVLDFPSPQSAEHNVSAAQGAAFGRRADYLDGHSLSGGVGVLYDQDGDDTYSCGVFGQGVGYWEGVGMLWDDAGADKYTGQWYVQGASAHFAIGYLEDQSGDDMYAAGMNMAMGAGHDFGTGFLFDWSGADSYTAPNLSLGAGNANGMGWFVDGAGADQYDSKGITLGKAAESAKGSLRQRAICLGVFMDLGGQDVYPALAPWAKNASRSVNMTDRGPTPAQGQLGVFWDR